MVRERKKATRLSAMMKRGMSLETVRPDLFAPETSARGHENSRMLAFERGAVGEGFGARSLRSVVGEGLECGPCISYSLFSPAALQCVARRSVGSAMVATCHVPNRRKSVMT